MKIWNAGLALIGGATTVFWSKQQSIAKDLNNLQVLASTVFAVSVNILVANTSKASLGKLGVVSLNTSLGIAAAYLAIQLVENTFEDTFKTSYVDQPLADAGMRIMNFTHLAATSVTCLSIALKTACSRRVLTYKMLTVL